LKRDVVKKAKELLDQGYSLRKTAAYFNTKLLNLSAIQLSVWIKSENKMNDANPSGIMKSTQACSLNAGRTSSIAGFSSQLLEWIITNRDLGMPVSRNMVVRKASSLDAEFCRKTKEAKYQIIRRFLKSNNLVTPWFFVLSR
jgi:hypothetical protein